MRDGAITGEFARAGDVENRLARPGIPVRVEVAERPVVVRSVNAKLIQSERQLLDPAGLKNRQWFRHLLYAPGFYTGYAVKTLPGVREGIEQKAYAEVEPEVARAAKAIDRLTALVSAAAGELEAR